MPAQNILIFGTITFVTPLTMGISSLSIVPWKTWQQTSLQKPFLAGRPNISRTPSGFFGLRGSVRIQTVRKLDKYLFIIIDIFGQLLSTFYCASLCEHTSYGYLYPCVLTSWLQTAHSFVLKSRSPNIKLWWTKLLCLSSIVGTIAGQFSLNSEVRDGKRTYLSLWIWSRVVVKVEI